MNLALRVLALLVVLSGCPSRRSTLGAHVPDVPTNGDRRAHDRFEQLKAQFLRDARSVPADEFKQIAEQFPDDPIVPWADLYAGEASLKARNFTEADKQLTQVMNAGTNSPRADLRDLAAKAKLYLGIAKNYEGDTAGARALLATSESAIDADSQIEFWSAMAFSLAAGDQPWLALPYFDKLWDGATPTERAVILGRVEEVVGAIPVESLRGIFKDLANRGGPSIALVGTRMVFVSEANGDAASAEDMRGRIAPVRDRLGLPRTLTATLVSAAGSVNPGLVGAVLPLGGNSNAVAQRAAEGLGLAAGAPSGKGVVAIEVRTATDAAASAAAVDQLAGQNVIAIVGPIGDGSVDSGGARAEALGVPLLTLTPHAGGRTSGKFIFHMRHSPEARARVLARRALAKGIKTFAIFAPRSDYGKSTTAAFVDEVTKGKDGGTVVEIVDYPTDPKSLATAVAKAAGNLVKSWDAVFVPADSDTLELIAPALAASGHVAKAYPFPPKKQVKLGRPMLLLSTAEDLKDAFLLNNTARDAEGALLAPGYYPDNAEPANKAFIDQHVAAYGKAPGATAAYAYDAAQLAAAAGGTGRAGLASTLSKDQLGGVTGTIKFDANHQRSDDGIVYTVVEETGGVWAIRVAH